MSNYSVETVYQVWNDKNGDRLEFGPDADGLGLYRIVARGKLGNLESEIVAEGDAMVLLAKSILKELEK